MLYALRIKQVLFELCYTGGKLASLEEFRVQRDELLNQTAQLEATLQEQEQIHQSQIYDLEKKQVIDVDRYSSIMLVNLLISSISLQSLATMRKTKPVAMKEALVSQVQG